MRTVDLYTAGASKSSHIAASRGGWTVLMRCAGQQKYLYGHEIGSSAKRMELKAAVTGLQTLKFPCVVNIVTGSQYLYDCSARIEKWNSQNWRNKNGGAIDNEDLIKDLYAQMLRHKCSFTKDGDDEHVETCKIAAETEAGKLQVIRPALEDLNLMSYADSLKELIRRGR